jgi:hypothetical protein
MFRGEIDEVDESGVKAGSTRILRPNCVGVDERKTGDFFCCRDHLNGWLKVRALDKGKWQYHRVSAYRRLA